MNKLILIEWLKNFKEIKSKNSIKIIDKFWYSWKIKNEDELNNLSENELKNLTKKIKNIWEITIKEIKKKNKKMICNKPYNESLLSIEANKYLWFWPKQTTTIGQKLYEMWLTTYLRTKWNWLTNWSKKSIFQLLKNNWIKEIIDRNYPLPKDAWHDAIRTAYKQKLIEKNWLLLPKWYNLDELSKKLFDLITRKTISLFLPEAELEVYLINWKIDNIEVELTLSKIKKEWFLKYFTFKKREIKNLIDEKLLENYLNKWNKIEIEDIKLEKDKFNFKDAVSYNLFKKTLEWKKIWTPATVAQIFDKIKQKQYIKYDWKTELYPLAKWIIINAITKDIEVNDLNFTEKLLSKIEEIEEWKLSKNELLNSLFKKYFENDYENYKNFTFKKSTKKTNKKRKTKKKK